MTPIGTQKLGPQDLFALGRRIAVRRRTKDWSQRRLGRQSGIQPNRLSKIENGLATPNLAELVALSTALDASLDELARGVVADDSRFGRHILPPLQELEDLASPEECAILGKLLRILIAGFQATRPGGPIAGPVAGPIAGPIMEGGR